LSILFGAQHPQPCVDTEGGDVQAIPLALARLADFVVMDLGASLGAPNRSALEHCHSLSLVIERDPICLPLARFMLQQIDAASHPLRLIAPVLVNRAPLFSPFPLADIERELGVPPVGVIPPAPDLFLAAQNAHKPAVTFQPEGLTAGAFLTLAENLAKQIRWPPIRTERADSMHEVA
jgi:Flp pilus assembly CpaE family ATPase